MQENQSLIDNSDRHDPGGKVRLRVDDSIKSAATFSACGRYRQVLTRTWATDLPKIMFVGMNPSTANLAVDDPTVRKERQFACQWGYGTLIKVNVMDYRATYPKDLIKPDVVAQSPDNLCAIQKLLTECKTVVAAWGKINPLLAEFEQNLINLLKAQQVNVMCLGTNINGSPKHPLYLSLSTTLVPWKYFG